MSEKDTYQICKSRVSVLYAIFIFLGLVVVGKILWLQMGPGSEKLKLRAIEISYDRVDIEANRGDILAHDGRVLATSLPTFEIRMDFAAGGLSDKLFEDNVDSLAYYLANFFKDKNKVAYKKLLKSARENRKRYQLISPRRVDYLELHEIQKFPLFRLGANKGGFISNQVNVRRLPHGSLAKRTIGQVNKGGSKWGIEGAFDEHLRGIKGNYLMQKISGNFKVPVDDENNIEPEDGLDVLTTIDIDVQDVAEQALKTQLERGNAQWGTVVLMEVATGEVRAISNITRSAPGVYEDDNDYAIGMSLEPGSTFKLATLMALLDDGGMKLTDEIDTHGGKAVVRGKSIEDDHKEGILTLKQVFELSSNIGFAKCIDSIYHKDPNRFVDYIASLGMGDKLGMQIAGEVKPQLKRKGEKWWDGYSLTLMSYGYALRLTPMHTLALYNAIANNGTMVRPMLVKELRRYGETVETFDTEIINEKICSTKTLKSVREALQGVVDSGTAQRALKNPYYTVAAKTGTAQIALDNGGYRDEYGGMNYLATLVGYFPADNPKYSCIVAIKTYYGRGSWNTIYGASLSAPVFRAIADQVYASNVSWQKNVENTIDSVVYDAPVIKAGSADQMITVAKKLKLDYNKKQNKTQWATSKLDSTGVNVIKDLTIKENLVPYVVGMGLKDALYILEDKGFKVSYSGRGRVVYQSLRQGTLYNKGSNIILRLN
ncbi:MAG: penicillin-binding protein [Rikenellaceae bacterium]